MGNTDSSMKQASQPDEAMGLIRAHLKHVQELAIKPNRQCSDDGRGQPMKARWRKNHCDGNDRKSNTIFPRAVGQKVRWGNIQGHWWRSRPMSLWHWWRSRPMTNEALFVSGTRSISPKHDPQPQAHTHARSHTRDLQIGQIPPSCNRVADNTSEIIVASK